MDRYFNHYRDGSWWLYEAASDLKDSVYITGTQESYFDVTKLMFRKGTCSPYTQRNFDLHSSYLGWGGAPVRGLYYSETAIGSGFNLHASGDFSWNGHSYEGTFTVVDSLVDGVLLHNAVALNFPDGTYSKSWLLAEGFGIYQFTTGTDTFSLVQSSLQ